MSGLFSFPKEEKLCSRKLIDELFLTGKSRSHGCLRMVYMPVDESVIESRVQLLITAPKKRFRRAVKRNLLKRRMREAYRLNKNILIESLERKSKKYVIAILYAHSEVLPFAGIESDLIKLLEYLAHRIDKSV
jgi:ribonuclease P protein component